MAHPILSEDWSEYDQKKIRDGRDGRFVSCEESWERDYILRKVRRHVPRRTDAEIKAAIEHCCRTVAGNKPRGPFMECVMGRL